MAETACATAEVKRSELEAWLKSTLVGRDAPGEITIRGLVVHLAVQYAPAGDIRVSRNNNHLGHLASVTISLSTRGAAGLRVGRADGNLLAVEVLAEDGRVTCQARALSVPDRFCVLVGEDCVRMVSTWALEEHVRQAIQQVLGR